MKNMRGENKRIPAEQTWLPSKTEIEWLYHQQNWSLEQIANYYNVSQTGMSRVIKRLGIVSRERGRQGMLNGRYKNGQASTLYRVMIEKDKCSQCQAIERLVIHHKNFNHQDNHLENLQVLCESCHNRLHKKRWWDIQKLSLSQTPHMG